MTAEKGEQGVVLTWLGVAMWKVVVVVDDGGGGNEVGQWWWEEKTDGKAFSCSHTFSFHQKIKNNL